MYKPTTKIIIGGKKKLIYMYKPTAEIIIESQKYMKKDTVHIIIDDKKFTCIKLPIKSSLMV